MSNPKPRQYTRTTIRKLDTLSGNECSAPLCNNKLISKDLSSIVSKICHIEAACKGGPRYNKDMNDDERRHFDNLILLCDECHTIIDNKDNEKKYPVKKLKEWKKVHESKQISKLNNNQSLLKTAIYAIADADIESIEVTSDSKLKPYNIDNKILHNCIKRNKALINQYKVFHSKINTIYGELEAQGSFKKENLLSNINRLYLKTVGKYSTDSLDLLEDIRKNADSIIEDIEEELESLLIKEDTPNSSDFAFAISVILVDAFIKCKILEEPEHDFK